MALAILLFYYNMCAVFNRQQYLSPYKEMPGRQCNHMFI